VKWSRWLTWLGVAIALAGVVLGVWLLILEGGPSPFGPTVGAKFANEERVQDVALGLSLVAAGALLAVAAQIMGIVQTRGINLQTDPLP
jgi:drug/metabolite transporter (DMT)-like permease